MTTTNGLVPSLAPHFPRPCFAAQGYAAPWVPPPLRFAGDPQNFDIFLRLEGSTIVSRGAALRVVHEKPVPIFRHRSARSLKDEQHHAADVASTVACSGDLARSTAGSSAGGTLADVSSVSGSVPVAHGAASFLRPLTSIPEGDGPDSRPNSPVYPVLRSGAQHPPTIPEVSRETDATQSASDGASSPAGNALGEGQGSLNKALTAPAQAVDVEPLTSVHSISFTPLEGDGVSSKLTGPGTDGAPAPVALSGVELHEGCDGYRDTDVHEAPAQAALNAAPVHSAVSEPNGGVASGVQSVAMAKVVGSGSSGPGSLQVPGTATRDSN